MDCLYKDGCNGKDCEKSFCLRKYKLDTLYNSSLLSLAQRKTCKLFPDADGTDLEEFKRLAAIQNNIEKFVADGENLFIHSSNTGNGKAQPDDSLIFCKNGFVSMKDIQPGQELFGEDGNLHSVVAKFDRGNKKVYKVTFQDGSSTECCDEHLWTVYDHKEKQFKTIELSEIMNYGLKFGQSSKQGGHWRFDIPVTSALNINADNKNYLNPYVLGYILGDGNISKSGLSIAIGDLDAEESISRLNSLLPEGYVCSNGIKCSYNIKLVEHSGIKNTFGSFENKVKSYLLKLGLMNTNSYTKFIPDVYKYSSIEDRISLIQGLMDTDGTVSKQAKGGCQISYATVSKQLAEDFAFIIESLGGTCSVRERKGKSYVYKGEKKLGHTWYNCTIKLPLDIQPFRLSRKINTYNELKNHYQRTPYRTIRSIEYVGQKHCYCIMTDNPTHLYLTDNLIVTHNTSWAIRMLQVYINKIWPKSDTDCKVLFISVPRLLQELKDSISNKSDYVKAIKENVLKADLVIWDEVGAKAGTEFEINQLFVMIDSRIAQNKANIYTANTDYHGIAAAFGERLASRICLNSTDIEFHGADKRSLRG